MDDDNEEGDEEEDAGEDGLPKSSVKESMESRIQVLEYLQYGINLELD